MSAQKPTNNNPRHEVQHKRLRRKAEHDYTGAGVYLITVSTRDRERLLGTLKGDTPDEARIEPTTLGEYVVAGFRKMAGMISSVSGQFVQVLQYQLMPDHFHGIVYIREKLPQGWTLGRMIGAWKGDCSREFWRENATLTPGAHDEKAPLFSPGYNDKILFHEGQLKNWISYLRDNPRRLWLKLHNPDRLRKEYEFRVGISSHAYTAVGNTFLVTYPERVQVRCHRNLTDEEIRAEVRHYLSLSRRGVVLVSPFISPAEKAVYEACYQEKRPMIRIVNRGLDGRFVYPTGRDLTGCSEGFLLVLAPYADYSQETAETRITRAQCLDMNGFAADLATPATLTPGAHNENNATLTPGAHNENNSLR